MKSEIVELETYKVKQEIKKLDKEFIKMFNMTYDLIDNEKIIRCIKWEICNHDSTKCFGICLPGNNESSMKKFENEINKNYDIDSAPERHLKEREHAIDKSDIIILCRDTKTENYDESTIHDYFYAKTKDKIIIFRDDFK